MPNSKPQTTICPDCPDTGDCSANGCIKEIGAAVAPFVPMTDKSQTTAFRARECNLSGEWIVETEMMCINGLAAWVSVAGCGRPDASDEMTGYDPEAWAKRIAAALDAQTKRSRLPQRWTI